MKKSLRRKLLLSGLAMGVAAVSLASTTYAWFSKIDSVNANSANVTASTPSSLYISRSSNGGWGTSINFGSAITFDAVKEGVRGNFWAITDEAKKTVDTDGKLTGAHATAELEDNDTYDVAATTKYFVDTFYLKYEGTDGKYKDVDWTVTDSLNAEFSEGLADDIHFEVRLNSVSGDLVKGGTMNEFATWKTGTFDTLKANTVYTYVLLIWVDEDCKNSDVLTSVTANYSINFSIENKAEKDSE